MKINRKILRRLERLQKYTNYLLLDHETPGDLIESLLAAFKCPSPDDSEDYILKIQLYMRSQEIIKLLREGNKK